MTTPAPHGALTPSELSFLAESEEITIIPRQRLDSLDLVAGHIPGFRPPARATIPLWLALVLKKQRRCNIVPPAWLNSHNIASVLQWENDHLEDFSKALPWRWLETAEMLLDAAADDIPDANVGGERDLRVLLRGLREVRQTKAREGLRLLEGTFLKMNGLGIMEITEVRGFAGRVVDGLRRLGATREETKRAEEEEGGMDDDNDDDEMSTVGRSTTAGRSTTVGRSSAAVRGSSGRGASSAWDEDEDM